MVVLIFCGMVANVMDYNVIVSEFTIMFTCYVLTFDPAQNAIQGDAPEGSNTFQWQLWEEIAWAEIGWWNGMS